MIRGAVNTLSACPPHGHGMDDGWSSFMRIVRSFENPQASHVYGYSGMWIGPSVRGSGRRHRRLFGVRLSQSSDYRASVAHQRGEVIPNFLLSSPQSLRVIRYRSRLPDICLSSTLCPSTPLVATPIHPHDGSDSNRDGDCDNREEDAHDKGDHHRLVERHSTLQ